MPDLGDMSSVASPPCPYIPIESPPPICIQPRLLQIQNVHLCKTPIIPMSSNTNAQMHKRLNLDQILHLHNSLKPSSYSDLGSSSTVEKSSFDHSNYLRKSKLGRQLP
jgi:hypothetical protein